MFEIIDIEKIAPHIKRVELKAPLIAKFAKAGQFVVLRIHDKGERIPLTIFKRDTEKGTIQLVFQEVGKTTFELGDCRAGDRIMDVVGPLGKPTPVEKYGTAVVVGGGVGTPIAYAVAAALKEAGNEVIGIAGFRNKEMVILEEDLKEVCDEFLVTTDDGSYVRKGFTTDVLKEILDSGKKVDYVFAVGPPIMMKLIADLTRKDGIKTVVSLNPIMVDGTGMCGACRVSIRGEIKFACVDGPDFDAHEVDFDELMRRLTEYKDEEKEALGRYLSSR
ncbi:MAG: sulfide/dihydroorotate dehydrogenase-like FAD/NAD-binding protein [Thermoplasmata archaeon]|nr:MAG: sulfide/dihydroorotate dehydrogenase-like FAD/NAD-binding protein [Thermoplasmata archaeon]